jgi:hypothetical protein
MRLSTSMLLRYDIGCRFNMNFPSYAAGKGGLQMLVVSASACWVLWLVGMLHLLHVG